MSDSTQPPSVLREILATAGRDEPGTEAAPQRHRRPATVPGFRSFELPIFVGRRAGYIRIMWMTRRRWKRSPWAEDKAWRLMPVGVFVIAVKFELEDAPAWKPFHSWRHRCLNPITGELIEIDIIFATTRTWKGSPWAASPKWAPFAVGPFTIGIQVMC